MKLNIGTKISFSHGVMLLFMLLISGFVLKNLDRMIDDFSFVIEHDAPVIANINKLQKLVIDVETGQRGFIITGKEVFLEPYTEGLRQFQQLLDTEEQLVSDNPQQVKRLQRIAHLLEQWLQQAGIPEIEARHRVNQGTVSADHLQQVVGSAKGKTIIDNIRAVVQGLSSHYHEVESPAAQLLANQALKAMIDQETGVRGFLISGKEVFLQPFHQGKIDFSNHIRELRRVESQLEHKAAEAQANDAGGRNDELLLNDLERLSSKWLQEVATPEIEARREMNRHPETIDDVAQMLESGVGKELQDQMRIEFEIFIDIEEQLTQSRYADATMVANQTRNFTIGITLLFVLIALILVFLITRSITTPILALRDASTAIGDGQLDTPIEIRGRDEISELATSFRRMTGNLLQAQEESDRRSWVDEGISQINDTIRGEKPSRELASNIIEQLCSTLGASVGILYLRMDNDRDGNLLSEPELHLTGSYAYIERKNLSSHYRWGESLVGQAALEEKPIRLSNIPDDYVKVTSGLGESAPHHLLVVPFLFEQQVIGVIELGTIEPLHKDATDLISRVVESIGIAFQSANSREALGLALKDSQTLSEELQVQQEELQESNEQLEEQSQALDTSRKDVEERNRRLQSAQGELNERAEQLEQSSKYKSEFLANMSHELRTPLNSILLLSKLIAGGDVESEEERRNNAQVIYDAGNDLLGLINEVLDLSKIEAGKMAIHLGNIDVTQFANSFKSLFEPQAKEKGLEFSVQVEEGLPQHIQSDQDRLQQVLRNFLSNAMKFTQSGTISVEVSAVTPSLTHKLMTFGNLREQLRQHPQNYIVFSISDTGVGIPEEKHQLVFEAFQQADGSTSRTYGGTGLGLSISNQIAAMLEGALALNSSTKTTDHGSTFSIVIPISPSMALSAVAETTAQLEQSIAEPESTLDVSAPWVGASLVDDQMTTSPKDERTLLVVEDDPRFAQTLIDLGHKHRYKVIHAGTGTEGVRLAEHYRPSAILLDIQLPILDGWGVLRHLKKNPDTRHIPIHVLSVMEEQQFGYRLGAAEYLVKPVKPEELEEAFEHIEVQLKQAVKKLLVVEDNDIERESIIKLVACGHDIECIGVGTGAEALEELRKNHYDAFILDLQLPDMSGYEVLEAVAADTVIQRIPTIVYTGKDLSMAEEKQLRIYAESIVLKTAESPARLLDETSIFLHRVWTDLSEDRQKLLTEVSNTDEQFKERTILLVDDDIRNTFALSAVLEKRGLTVRAADNGEEALELLDEHADKIDLVLMDIMMPVMDGYEATRKIREQKRFEKLPVIALTAKALKEDRDLCIAAGASDYMTKPIDYDQLS